MGLCATTGPWDILISSMYSSLLWASTLILKLRLHPAAKACTCFLADICAAERHATEECV